MIKAITNNLGVKILCLVLSFCMWYVYQGEETISKTIKFRVIPRVNKNMFIMHVSPKFISVTIKGGRKEIKQIKVDPAAIEIDLTHENTAKVVHKEISDNYFSFDSTIRIMKILPAKVEIELDKLINKTVELEAVTKGQVAPNYDLSGIKLTPNRLKIWGPENILNQLKILKTEKIDIDGMNSNFVQEVYVVPPYESFSQNYTIKATIAINKSKQEKVFEKIPIKVMLQSTGMLNKCSVSPSVVSLKIEASVIDLQGVTGEDFLAFINISDMKAGSYQLPVSVVKKDVFKIKDIYPKSVEVIIGDRL